jgi:DNA adenine methylase
MGGKSRLAARIVERIPEHTCYVEPFCGAAWVFFRKEPSKVEVLNDINSELVNLYRVVKHHLDELIRCLRWMLVSREEFERQQDTPPECLTDVQRAVRFYYLQKTCYGGRVRGQNFGYSTTQPPRIDLTRIGEDLSMAHMRLARTYIEHLPFQEVIAKYDRPATFFYLDPPYFGCEDDYGRGVFAREDFARLAEMLRSVRGSFMLSLNRTPEVLAIFKGFSIEEVATSYNLGGNGTQ